MRNKRKSLPTRQFEQLLNADGFTKIAGIDEAGRGPLAGPVVAAAVILPQDCELVGVDDSKRLTPSQREQLYIEIMQQAESVGVGIVSEKVIDEINVLQASMRAMMQAVEQLLIRPDCLLIDAVTLSDCSLPQRAIIKGDQKSVSIASASIVAKVVRDDLMRKYHLQYPAYGFAQHKGYATELHIAAIKQFGICQIHRKTFVTQYLI